MLPNWFFLSYKYVLKIKIIIFVFYALKTIENKNNIYNLDFNRAKEYLIIAREYAIKANQDSLLKGINDGLLKIEKKIRENN